MVEGANLESIDEVEHEHKDEKGRFCNFFCAPIFWGKMLANETHWTLVFAVLSVYGVSQGLGGAFSRIATEYYFKDAQKLQPSESQIYQGILSIPWLVKPIWGLLTDVLPVLGYRRRPYFVIADTNMDLLIPNRGVKGAFLCLCSFSLCVMGTIILPLPGLLGGISMLLLSLHEKMHLLLALLLLTAGSAGVAIADVTIDACVAKNSNIHPLLAPDLQSLCTSSSSIGALVGFSISGIFVHWLGPKGVFGLLLIPFGLVLLVGILYDEPLMPGFSYRQVHQKFADAGKAMWTTMKFPDVWRPCLYMYVSFALSVNIYEGMFFWYTDSKDGPSFSQETVGFIFSVGSVGSLLAAILYQNFLKDHPFRNLLFWSQLLFGFSGMLDLIMVLRLNLKFGIPDYVFVVLDESVSKMILNLKWMPLLVLTSKLCPSGIEGTFFALLMSIDNAGLLSSSWLGGLLLHLFNVTRTNFDNLWLVIIIRSLLRVSPLCLIFLVPRGTPDAFMLPSSISSAEERNETPENPNLEMVALVSNVDS